MKSLESIGVVYYPQAALSDYTTFQLGGPCLGLFSCRTSDQVEKVIQFAKESILNFIVIGGGSNLVVADKGVDCYVIRYCSETSHIEQKENMLIVSGSTQLDDLAVYAVDQGLEGINYASGIPGTVAGAVVGNAGAFGKQIGDIVESVEVINYQSEKRVLLPDDLGFEYRSSDLKKIDEIVLSVKLKLRLGNKEKLQLERDEILQLRKDKHPNWKETPCAGSFFRNIDPSSASERRQAAGWFLEQSGAKDLKVGGASLFPKHANIIIGSKDCKSEDVYQLSKKMKQCVKDRFQIDLQREVQFLGELKGFQ